ncbi:cell division topological specificity factor MinE [Methylomicrobium sp. wino1]|jgi:cell division topological specificity factor|uniref:cell division topological specificity factor MinE n=1 Tax=unclassified Methylotuvimicrobium TaxID=2822412 RepID=UPI000CC39DE6|nr:cell division topological specificity factor MinE [Gammaproteobacteria bacterium]PKM35405.1 MAG: cell division topological specificity factor MinE [Gammaproteobacteria bacterium HGW-Gammaproteobacteria-10]HBA66988.1 cell division topological specificity factor MinE [Methylococcaceae bacterium]
MSLLDYFRTTKPSSASIAKERLQILVAHERSSKTQPSYLPQLQKELLEVIRKYVNVEQDAISVNFEQDDDQEILELNIVLPDEHDKVS